jgi:hypothetical protein
VRDFRKHTGFLHKVLELLAKRGFTVMQDLSVRLDFNGFFAAASAFRRSAPASAPAAVRGTPH